MKRIALLISSFIAFIFQLSKAQQIIISDSIQWHIEPIQIERPGIGHTELFHFDNAVHSGLDPGIPKYLKNIPLDNQATIADYKLNILKESPANRNSTKTLEITQENYKVDFLILQERNQYYLQILIHSLRQQGSAVYKLEKFELTIQVNPTPSAVARNNFKTNSILSNPGFVKFKVSETGIYKIDAERLRRAGINPDQINPKNIRIFGSTGGMLPELNSAPRIDDLEELAIYVHGEQDEIFDSGDYILVYVQGPEQVQMDTARKKILQFTNIYDRSTYIFLNTNLGRGKRIKERNMQNNPDYTTTHFDDWIHFEQDLVNLGHLSPYTSGSGRIWLGENFRINRERSYPGIFNFPDRLVDHPITLDAAFAGRSSQSSRFQISINGRTKISTLMGSTNLGHPEFPYARSGTISDTMLVSGANLELTLRYPEIPGAISEGWLDFITINARRKLKFYGQPLFFQDFESVGKAHTRFVVENGRSGLFCWNITDLTDVQYMVYDIDIQGLNFVDASKRLQRYALFDPNGILPTPEFAGGVDPQNLHSMSDVDYLIVYHPVFESEVQRLALHHANHNGVKVGLASIDKVFNEFSAGRQDVVAIRDLARMIYERNPNFNYLLLFGDCTFDYRNIYNFEGTQNHVPCWQTLQSFDPIFSFPSDDFYALLDPDEGANLRGAVDIAVGRFPVNTLIQARTLVDKVIGYELDLASQGDWRLNVTFFADDEDRNKHVNDSDDLAEWVRSNYPVFNVDKIYLDAFTQIITPGGERFPTAKEAINKSVFRGNLVLNYFGHGGPTGLAQERVVEIQDINNWNNIHRLMLFITATCTFGAYDNPFQTSAGELTLLNPRGGAFALLTTTRAVFADQNKRLTDSVFRFLFEKKDGRALPIGEVMRRGKNATSEDTLQANARKFTLLGDPLSRLGLASYQINTTKINQIEVNASNPDTLKALNRYTISAEVVDDQGQKQTWFNGEVDITVFDKEITLRTLGQNPTSFVREFTLQRNIIFKGKASVINGEFSFTFIVPKSIDFNFGKGRITYYAWQNDLRSASGVFRDIIIGGTGEGAELSKNGPLVQVFMNDVQFAPGGFTNENPVLLAKIEAENGINISGASIGHDLTATLSFDERNQRILNDFFQGEKDDFTRGEVRFPLFGLPEGQHIVTVQAFDVAHNPGEGSTEFTVVKGGQISIKNLLNYPNPFTTRTRIQFEHNLAGIPVDLQVQIYSISGQLVKTIEHSTLPNNFLMTDLYFDALDDYGQRLATGVYLYKVKIVGTNLNGQRITHESDFQKMVLLN